MIDENPVPAGLVASTERAVRLLAEFIRLGVRDVVVCPGSRSQALALAAAAAERAGALRVHVRIDERSAGFFALGVARETGMPAPIVVTSGTAVANLVPAAFEAHEGRAPMILLTADRPAELRGIRSNQTTRQAGILGSIARLSLDIAAAGDEATPQDVVEVHIEEQAASAVAAARGAYGGGAPGPVQLNVAFREPLSGFTEAVTEAAPVTAADAATDPDANPDAGAAARGDAEIEEFFARCVEARDADGGTAKAAAENAGTGSGEGYVHDDDALTVVIAGEGAGPEAEAFAHAAGLPLLAEVVSGARFGREAITAYATLIDDPQVGGLVERAIVFGHPTLTRQVPSLLRRQDVEVIVVDPYVGAAVDHYDPTGGARVVASVRTADGYDPRVMRRWLGAWVVPDRELRAARTTVHEPDFEAALATGYKERNAYARAEVAAMREPVTRELLAESVWRATWPHDRLVLAASRLVRVLDGLAPTRRLEVRANRGLAGIDGTIATALGIAVASQSDDEPALAAGTTRVLVGDLALLHDVGSLLLADGEERPRIQLVVGNDGGGTIFDGLEVAASADRAAFERVMYTPQSVEIESLASAYGWEYRRVETRVELERLFTAPVTGPSIVEVPLAR
ncbi:2-succinyl-5-enolpyruvyl-6-hydroxy-3-cyclohexene-1-carboxylic-acid synthase [Leucobacter sp. GX24907]